MGKGWDPYVQKALKIVGGNGYVPDEPDSLQKAINDVEDAMEEFDNGRKDLQTKVKALKTPGNEAQQGLRQYLAEVQKSDFGLDLKNKDDAKKVLQARAVLVGPINEAITAFAKYSKDVDELNKHVEELGDYKPPKTGR